MSRALEASLIFLCLVAGAYFVICSATEVWDLVWKVAHQ